METGGAYFGLEGVDPWDAERDARRGGMDKWRDATGYRVANSTPPAFRDVLLEIARGVSLYA